ncbi:carbohydrate kinase family protein [Georgenia faecalis]|uniref:carbohydrate kinase family protein n=1 Tax=Georgenia faecalis TaxID=2483799 RepID=UPI001F494BCA|nr:PfkB family carbohydrate kinase [Georgenia faecalis]
MSTRGENDWPLPAMDTAARPDTGPALGPPAEGHADASAAASADGTAAAPQLDVFLSGPLFLDIIFSGLPSDPRPGTEVWAAGMGSLPGGIANLAVATSRLGLTTGLAAGFGGDVYGQWCWQLLAEEGIDLRWSTRLRGQHTSVTASFAYGDDRSMVTHGHDLPMTVDELIGDPPATRAVITDLGGHRAEEQWWRRAAERGALVFADVGWDPTGVWDRAALEPLRHCHAFLPNEVEAMAYTRTDDPRAALSVLAELAPVVVVTRGPRGAIAVDSLTGEEAEVPSLAVDAIDPTGAGDVFAASFASGTLWGWPLAERMAFAALCSSLAVQQFGGSLAAPGMGDIHDWWARVAAAADGGDPRAAELRARYRFLDEALPARPAGAARRAEATFALDADL